MRNKKINAKNKLHHERQQGQLSFYLLARATVEVISIEKLIKNLVEKYHTNCPFELAKIHNIDVWYLDLPNNVRGFFTRILRRNYIAINSNYSYEWQRFTCAHELGHYFYDKGNGFYFIKNHTHFFPGKFEKRANLFAVKLLTYGEPIKGDETGVNYYKRNDIPADLVKELFDEGGYYIG